MNRKIIGLLALLLTFTTLTASANYYYVANNYVVKKYWHDGAYANSEGAIRGGYIYCEVNTHAAGYRYYRADWVGHYINVYNYDAYGQHTHYCTG